MCLCVPCDEDEGCWASCLGKTHHGTLRWLAAVDSRFVAASGWKKGGREEEEDERREGGKNGGRKKRREKEREGRREGRKE